MKKLRANVCAVTHAGRIRKENEDNYNLNGRLTSTGDLKKGSAFVQSMSEPFHLSVCDGMGGESYGEIASGIAVETIAAHSQNVYESGEDFSYSISNCLDDANSRICAEIAAKGKRMGTTLAAVYAVKGRVYCVNIGDTRVYHYSKGILEQISFDHTHAQTIVDAGQVSQDNINRIPDAKRLTRHLGVFPEEGGLSPNISVIDDIDDGDVILLCSDGLTDMLDDGEITEILSNGENAQTVASKLIRRALEKGGKDNITVMAAFMSVEESAIFAPIAAAVVGDSDADYEEEYRNSYGAAGQQSFEETPVSPYANADARVAEKKSGSKVKTIIIIVAIILLLTFIGLGVGGYFGVKALWPLIFGEETTTEQETTTYSYYQDYPVYTPPSSEIPTWSVESTSEESTTEDASSTTKKSTTTTRRSTTTTRRSTTTTRRQTTTTTTSSSTTTTESEENTTTTTVAETTTAVAETTTTTPAETTTTTSAETTTATDVNSNEQQGNNQE